MNLRRFRSAVTGLFVSRKDAQANPRETVGETVSSLKLLGMDAVQELDYAVKWLELRRGRVHDANCTYHVPSARCSCGLHRIMSGLRAVHHDLKHGL